MSNAIKKIPFGSLKETEKISCIYCRRESLFGEVTEWVDNDETPLCPKCGVDTILAGSLSSSELNKMYLEKFCNNNTTIK